MGEQERGQERTMDEEVKEKKVEGNKEESGRQGGGGGGGGGGVESDDLILQAEIFEDVDQCTHGLHPVTRREGQPWSRVTLTRQACSQRDADRLPRHGHLCGKLSLSLPCPSAETLARCWE